jgi:mgtE-like transporter
VSDPARQVVDYWISERRTMRHAFTAVSIAAVTSLLAGLTLAGMDHRIRDVEGLFVLIPVSIGMRGNIFGALAARFGTSIHSGLFEVNWDRDGVLYQNVYGAALLTLVTSVTMALIARGVAGLIGLETVSALDFVVVALVGGVLSSTVVLAVTIYISIASWRRGWDLDSVGAPLITAMGDVVTLPCLLAASYLVEIEIVTPVIGGLAIVAAIAALVRGLTDPLLVARRIVRESFPILAIAIVLDVLAGAVVQPRVGEVFLAYPALLIVIPGFLENTGALGAVLAARLGSKLHLGAISARAKPEAVAFLDGTIVLILGITVYALTAVSTLGLAEIVGADYPGVLRFIGITMLGGVLATLVASVIGYYAAAATFRFGFDPDNHTIPIVTSGMDLLGAICLVVALTIFGVA